MKRAFQLILLLLIGSVLHASAEPFLFRVVNANTNASLELVSLRIEKNSSQYTFLSNQEGLFTIPDTLLPARGFAHMIGFDTTQFILNRRTKTIQLTPSNTTLQTIVVTGQSKAILQRESMYNVQTISAKEIQQRGAVTLNEALQFNTGQWINQDNILGSSLNLGGIGGQNIKILINGVPLNGRENGNIDLGQINLQQVKRIEIIQGPMSVLYGSNAMGGVINLITETGKNEQGITLQTYLETIGKINIGATAYKQWNKHHISTSVARNFFNGWTNNDTGGRFQLWKPKTQYIGDVNYTFSPSSNFKLNYFISYLNETITNLGAPIINPFEGYGFDEYYRTQRLLQSLNTEIKLGKKVQFITNNSYTAYQRIKNRYKKNLVDLSQFETAGIGDQDTSIFNTLNLRGLFSIRGKKENEWQTGYEITHETGNSFKLADTTKSLFEGALFSSWTYKRSRWRIQPALRVIYNSRFAPAFTPALHGYYNLTPTTILRSSLAWGYRTPSLKELYLTFIDQNHTLLGNNQLKPELGLRWENSLVYNKTTNGKTINIEGLAAWNRIRNMIFLAALPGNAILRQYANIDQYENLTLQLRTEFSHRRYAIQQGISLTRVLASNQFQAYNLLDWNLNAHYNIPRYRLRLMANYKLNSRQALLTIDNQFYFTRAIHITGIAIQHQVLNNKATIQLGVKNLLNQVNSPLNGIGITTSGHIAPSGMMIAPARSIYLDTRFHL